MTGPITSASLSLYNPSSPPAPGPGFLSIEPLTYTTFDITTSISDLVASQSGATDIYNDLGTGTSYGSVVVDSSDNGKQIPIVLNGVALAAITAAEGSQFAIGGSVTSAVPSVPLPGALPMFGAAVAGAIGIARRKRRTVA